MTIDVVIPTGKNIKESHYSICYTIKSILSQNYKVNKIYVVENSNNTEVKKIIKNFFGNFVEVLNGLDKTQNISYARNLGVKTGNSDIILFIDDDVIIGRNDFLLHIKDLMSYTDFCCGASRYWTILDWHRYLSLDYPMSHNLNILKAKSFLPNSIDRYSGKRSCHDFTYIGNFGAIKRSVFESINGFDEGYKRWLYQDTDLMMRLCTNKYSYEILSYFDIYCYHLSHSTNKEPYREINKKRYEQKQKELGIHFNSSNFFGRFQDEYLEVIIPFHDK